MLLFIGFLIVAGFTSALFKFLAGLLEAIIIFPLFGFKNINFEHALETKPRRLISLVIVKNVIIGLANSIMIYSVCSRFVLEYEGHLWFYFALGCLWSLFIISDGKPFSGVFFWPSTVNFVLMWFGYGVLSIPIIGLLTIVVSISYYFGRIGMMQYYKSETIDVTESNLRR